MLNPAIDAEQWRGELDARTRVQVPRWLLPDAALQLQASLASQVPWNLAERTDGQSRTSARGQYPQGAAYEALLRAAYSRARDGYQFVYDNYFLVEARKQGWDPGLFAHVALDLFNSEQMLGLMRRITGDASLFAAKVQATRYRPGHFLLRHDDQDIADGKRYAYVLNLSHEWRADWGGLLQFLQPEGDGVVDTFLPRWNSLSLFKVPQPHQVSLVAPWAASDRYAITGWFLGR